VVGSRNISTSLSCGKEKKYFYLKIYLPLHFSDYGDSKEWRNSGFLFFFLLFFLFFNKRDSLQSISHHAARCIVSTICEAIICARSAFAPSSLHCRLRWRRSADVAPYVTGPFTAELACQSLCVCDSCASSTCLYANNIYRWRELCWPWRFSCRLLFSSETF
jgi:hypothetical protein